MTQVGLDVIDNSTPLESNKSLSGKALTNSGPLREPADKQSIYTIEL